jgi:hypothetical protein
MKAITPNTTTTTTPFKFSAGDRVTVHFHTDRHAYTVTRVSANGKTAWIQADGSDEVRVTLRKDGWVTDDGERVIKGKVETFGRNL